MCDLRGYPPTETIQVPDFNDIPLMHATDDDGNPLRVHLVNFDMSFLDDVLVPIGPGDYPYTVGWFQKGGGI